jgi:hypothetical protein
MVDFFAVVFLAAAFVFGGALDLLAAFVFRADFAFKDAFFLAEVFFVVVVLSFATLLLGSPGCQVFFFAGGRLLALTSLAAGSVLPVAVSLGSLCITCILAGKSDPPVFLLAVSCSIAATAAFAFGTNSNLGRFPDSITLLELA